VSVEQRSQPGSGTSAGKAAWALVLAAVFAGWSLKAFSPLARVWDLRGIDQEGQVTVFNHTAVGGQFGFPVELGDYDGDGAVDAVIAPMNSAGAVGDRPAAGEVVVFRGSSQTKGRLDRADPTTLRGDLTLRGARNGDFLGTEIFTADVNNDGIDDLLVSSQNFDGPAGDRDGCGGAWILFGRAGLLDGSTTVDVASPPSGVVSIVGARPGDRLGIWIEAGDLDGDGFADILLGADQSPEEDSPERHHAGMVVVIYGRESFPATIDLATDAEALPGITRILGRDPEDHFGSCLHAHDLDGDGRAELIAASAMSRLSARQNPGGRFRAHGTGGADGPDDARLEAGEVVVFFSLGPLERLPALIDLGTPLPPALAGRVTVIHGQSKNDTAGEELTAGDFNGDGLGDLVLGALSASTPPQSPFPGESAGKAHVLYGFPGFAGKTIDLASPESFPEGLVVSTLLSNQPRRLLGDTLSAGDFDHDGLDDLAAGIPWGPGDDRHHAGAVAIVFGRAEPWPAAWDPQEDVLPAGVTLAIVLGREVEDLLSYSMEARDFDGDGYSDLFPNAMRGDGSGDVEGEDDGTNTGEAYLVSGFRLTQASGKPELSAVHPADGPVEAATPVVIHGSGFTTDADTTVRAGGVALAGARVVNGRRIEVTVPPGETTGPVAIAVANRYGEALLAGGFFRTGAFIRGDVDRDGTVAITDPIRYLNFAFLGLGPIPCDDAADTDDSGALNLTDPIRTLNHLFLGGPPPAPPFPAPGADPTPDSLAPCP
jgi:hypothetical protein